MTNIAPDIYALGMTVLNAHVAIPQLDSNISDSIYNYHRFENTSYKYLAAKLNIASTLQAFFIGALHDDIEKRWNIAKLQKWIAGKQEHQKIVSITESQNFVSFMDNHYSTFQALSYALFMNWEEAMTFVKEDKILKWIVKTSIPNEQIDIVKSLFDKKTDTPFIIKNVMNSNIKIETLLSVMNPHGGLRQQGLSISANSIPSFLHYCVMKKDQALISKLLKMIDGRIWNKYQKYTKSVGYINQDLETMLRKHPVAKREGIANVFDLDKLLYILNPNSTCYTSILNNQYVDSINELMLALEKLAEMSPEKFVINQNITAFIAAKVNLTTRNILSKVVKFKTNSLIKSMLLLDAVQRNQDDLIVKNICKVLAKNCVKLFEIQIHNRKFKDQLKNKIYELSKNGSISQMLDIFADQDQFIEDYENFLETEKKIKILDNKINALKNANTSNFIVLGQQITVLISYVLCFIITVISIT